ncbi:coordinator of PRMT5 and differentiation stimulator isoform X2 [Cuculus canorus]|uniref:coordinator of PRMT5 and differentiation stimulator isoform X2 n=1 Tax=Cuculus canorus TaxID=55661 RepID=UPI0023AA7087|nr:coordinator of PRMT5 and differentiation stimulator isoform X2 [Cuculus canorus]
MAAAVKSSSCEEEQLLNEKEIVTWKPRKECLLKNTLDSKSEESEFSAVSHNGNDVSGSPVDYVYIHPDLQDLSGDVSSMPEAVTSPEPQTAAACEVEDWDKELEAFECSCYDAGDFHCGSFQESNFLASYSWQEDSFYFPGCHHAPRIAFPPPYRKTETGQFDDADE